MVRRKRSALRPYGISLNNKERAELVSLRRETKRLRMERDIVLRVLAWYIEMPLGAERSRCDPSSTKELPAPVEDDGVATWLSGLA
jgi:hypothetical protein